MTDENTQVLPSPTPVYVPLQSSGDSSRDSKERDTKENDGERGTGEPRSGDDRNDKERGRALRTRTESERRTAREWSVWVH